MLPHLQRTWQSQRVRCIGAWHGLRTLPVAGSLMALGAPSLAFKFENLAPKGPNYFGSLKRSYQGCGCSRNLFFATCKMEYIQVGPGSNLYPLAHITCASSFWLGVPQQADVLEPTISSKKILSVCLVRSLAQSSSPPPAFPLPFFWRELATALPVRPFAEFQGSRCPYIKRLSTLIELCWLSTGAAVYLGRTA